MTWLGIDLGTSALKVVIVDDAQRILAETGVPLRTHVPRPGWSEQDPHDWWSALELALAALRREAPAPFAAIRALGLSGQMHGAVLVDREGRPIRPAILWNDGRATAECAELEGAVPDLGMIAGVRAMPGFTAPKLLWLARHEPESLADLATILCPKDYLRLHLTGEAATDMCDAAGTLWLDEGARDWSDAILAATGLDRSHMPRLLEGTQAGAPLTREARAAFGFERDVLVAGGAGDAAAAAIGIGAVSAGDAFISLGTSAQFFVTDDAYHPQPDLLLHAFAHGVPGRWFRMGAMLNGASCLDFAARFVGTDDIAALVDETEAAYRGPSRVLFLPYLSGERTPHNDANARGVFTGLDHGVTRADLAQAAMEGVAFSLREAAGLIGASGIRLDGVATVGGGARSRFWMQIVADVIGMPVTRYAGSETGPAFGAARLARLAATGEEVAEVCVKPAVRDVSEPHPGRQAAYAERFPRYANLYRALRPEFAALATLSA